MRAKIEIVRLGSAGPPSFDCGADAQNAFLHASALAAQMSGASATHLAFDGDVCIGYITLAAGSVHFEKHERPPGALVGAVPALLVAQMAVAVAAKGTGLGEWLLRFASGVAQSLRFQIGCRYLAVDCTDALVPFYRRFGFTESKGEQRARKAKAQAQGSDAALLTHRLFRDLLHMEWLEADVAPPHVHMTELHRAAGDGDLAMLKALLDSGVTPELTMGRNDDGIGWGAKPLHIAVARNQLDALTMLLARGADVNAVDGDCETALHWAVRYANAEAVRLLLGSGANPSVEGGNAVFTPLDYAVHQDLEQIAVILRYAGGVHSDNF